MRRLVAVMCCTALVGCLGDREAPDGAGGPLLAERVDLSGVASEADPAVGVTFDSADRQFVLTRSGKLFEVNESELTLVHTIDTSEIAFGFTDITAIGEGVFALSSQSDGFRLELETGAFEQHFCYLPEEELPGEELPGGPIMVQTSYALAYAGGTIYAQPHTTPIDQPSDIRASFYSTYDADTGIDLSWFDASPRTVGGMAHFVDGANGQRLLTGYRDELMLVNLWTDHDRLETEFLGNLGLEAPVQIEGLALSISRDALVFIDANSNELRTLPLSETIRAARERRDNQPLGS